MRMAASDTSTSHPPPPAAQRADSTSHTLLVICTEEIGPELAILCTRMWCVPLTRGGTQCVLGQASQRAPPHSIPPRPTSRRRGKALRMLSREKAGAVPLRIIFHSS